MVPSLRLLYSCETPPTEIYIDSEKHFMLSFGLELVEFTFDVPYEGYIHDFMILLFRRVFEYVVGKVKAARSRNEIQSRESFRVITLIRMLWPATSILNAKSFPMGHSLLLFQSSFVCLPSDWNRI